LLQRFGPVAIEIREKIDPKLWLSGALMGARHGTVAKLDQTASEAVLTADGSLRRDSCRRRLDSCSELGDNALGRKIFTARALDATPLTPPVLPLCPAAKTDKNAGDRHRTTLRRVALLSTATP
jgi:hypothetical protein